jgi:hypothetical protein
MIEPPAFDAEKYTCPNCGAYSRQRWRQTMYDRSNYAGGTNWMLFEELQRVDCDACDEFQLWLNEKLLVPDRPPVPVPNADLSDEIKGDYREAASILGRSPRGAAALVRLAVQKLCVQLGGRGHTINDDIAALVAAGLPVQIQQALDVVRVVGNNAVHPGQIDLHDDVKTATALFDLVNLIADNRISEPKRIASMYAGLPAPALEQIEKRDQK